MRLKRIKIQMSLLTSLQATQALRRNVDADMTFINDSLISELCERFDIQSISLFKSKSIHSYDKILDRRFITHALYISVTIQEHKNEMMLLLITRLDQHKIIIDNL